MNGLSKLAEPCYPDAVQCGMEERGIKVRLVRDQKRLREQLAKVDAAVEALNKNPEVAELLEKVMGAL